MITPNVQQLTPSMVVAEDRSNDEPVRLAGRRISVSAVWRETFAAFGNNAPPIVLCALIGFAGPAIVCILLSAVMGLDFYGQASGPLATWLGIGTLPRGHFNLVSALVWLQAVLGAIGLAFAHGVIARLALSDSNAEDAPSLSVACRETKARFLSLLIGSLTYGVFVALGAVGVNAALRDTAFDLSRVGQRSVTVPAHTKVLALRALDAFVPSPGSPFAEFVPALRQFNFISRPSQSVENLNWQEMNRQMRGETHVPLANTPTPVEENHAHGLTISLANLGALLLAEALLRFTQIMAMRSCERGRLRAIMPVLRSVRFGIRHFGTITAHVWLLRLAFVVVYSVFFMLPVVLSQDVAPSVMTSVREAVMGHWSLPLTLTCYWLVMALFMAFSTVYDARLVLALAQKADLRTVVRQTMTLTPEDRATVAEMSTSKRLPLSANAPVRITR